MTAFAETGSGGRGREPGGGRPRYHFHISRTARARYGFGGELFSARGNVIFMDLRAVRLFTRRMNEVRRAAGDARFLGAGDMNAMGLIDEILHFMARLFSRSADQAAFPGALGFLRERLGAEALDRCMAGFLLEFPPPEVHEGRQSAVQFLEGRTGETPNREIVLEEILHLWLANANPAFAPFGELFPDEGLAANTEYRLVVDALGDYFRTRPLFGPDNQDLVTLLRSPAIASPTSLAGQLEFIRTRWGYLLGDLLLRLLTAVDVIREEEKLRFGFFVPGPPEVYEYASQYAEVEAFSADKDWMPRVVMIAKNVLVWLDQLSRRYGSVITHLDQVPDEELDRLSRAGFTALWLIGVWERSRASRAIKRMMGNPEAEASAYSLFDYEIAGELGGEPALRDLKERAWRRGIRLASDMVPNHTGIDSRWVIEAPHRFLTYPRPYPPFPSYTFSGPNLAEDSRVGVFLEDHYATRSDAAVVFKRVDFATGDTRFIYHGNDGTHLPWNDTAQLDFLNPETREEVIRKILRVAGMFPIIRFDAAMTLTKKHFQRLWFPEPGKGGDIPSRAECGLTRHDFDHAMPAEFWREVVDRAAAEAPDTLLLAEAFWLLEGFFVRTLGMHRVYNSAFMNMMKTEDNAGYRQTMKNTMEFDPEVLKRFVNFMSNPDEETAIGQFGDGDKYFGVCTLMATLPGLPMFAHGQVEGLREKYGMEFRRGYWDEQPRDDLVRRHEREIFPLLKRRHLFSGVDGFLLYDVYDPAGWVNEDVFAYSNQRGTERALVLFNNRYREAKGWIRVSAAFAVKDAGGKHLVQRTLAEGLGLSADEGAFVIFCDHVRGLEYIRSCRELRERGMYVELGAFQYDVFLDFRDVRDDASGRWAQLAGELAGRGVPSMDEALWEKVLRPVRDPFRALVNAGVCRRLFEAMAAGGAGGAGGRKGGARGGGRDASREAATDAGGESAAKAALVGELMESYARFLSGIRLMEPEPVDERNALEHFQSLVHSIVGLDPASVPGAASRGAPTNAASVAVGAAEAPELPDGGLKPLPTAPIGAVLPVLWPWAVLRPLCGPQRGSSELSCRSASWLTAWRLAVVVRDCCTESGWDGDIAYRASSLLTLLLESFPLEDAGRKPPVPPGGPSAGPAEAPPTAVPRDAAVASLAFMGKVLGSPEAESFLRVNSFEGTRWFHKESLEMLVSVVLWLAEWLAESTGTGGGEEPARICLEAARASGYKWDDFLSAVRAAETTQG